MKNPAKRALCGALAFALVPLSPAFAEAAASAPHAFTQATTTRSILIDASSATLFMLEGGHIVDSMKVIVGKPDAPTPELKTFVAYASFNPYWNVPPEIARTLTAPNVLKQGVGYLTDRGYEVVTSFDDDAEVLDPASVDWQAVADGRATVFVRQRPGPANSMGRVKFALAAGDGIYLHDTPRKELFAQDERDLSHGCVRLEDAPRLARWLLGDRITPDSAGPDDRVPLDRYVPVTIAYLSPQAEAQLASLR